MSNTTPVTPHAPLVSSQMSQELPSFHDWAHCPLRSPPTTPITASSPVHFPPLPADLQPQPRLGSTTPEAAITTPTDPSDAARLEGATSPFDADANGPAWKAKGQLSKVSLSGLPPCATNLRLTAEQQQSPSVATSHKSRPAPSQLPVLAKGDQRHAVAEQSCALTEYQVVLGDEEGVLAAIEAGPKLADTATQVATQQRPEAGDMHKATALQEQGTASVATEPTGDEVEDNIAGAQAQPFSIPFSSMSAAFGGATNVGYLDGLCHVLVLAGLCYISRRSQHERK